MSAHPTEDMTTRAAPSRSAPSRWAVVLLAAIALVLIAQFPLDHWADITTLNHEIQHGLIFMGGIGAGVALARLHAIGSNDPRKAPS